jgi:hypothetical protein
MSGAEILGRVVDSSFKGIEPGRCERVDHPDHYNNNASGIECIDVVEQMDFCSGNAIKYIWRHMEKDNPVEDLKKAAWYISRRMDVLEGEERGDENI